MNKSESDKELNDLRCIASEIIVKLYKAEKRRQLELLKMHVDKALDELS